MKEKSKEITCFYFLSVQGEYSQPFLKPPHLDQPISTLLLSESTMAYGRILVSDSDGNYKGPLTLSLKEGYVLNVSLVVLNVSESLSHRLLLVLKQRRCKRNRKTIWSL